MPGDQTDKQHSLDVRLVRVEEGLKVVTEDLREFRVLQLTINDHRQELGQEIARLREDGIRSQSDIQRVLDLIDKIQEDLKSKKNRPVTNAPPRQIKRDAAVAGAGGTAAVVFLELAKLVLETLKGS